MDIRWQRGTFHKFWTKMKIRVGGANPIDIQSGDEFEYDGSILKYGGAEISSPQARGMMKENWVTTQPDGDTAVDAYVPSRNIAKATSVNKDLSRVARGNHQTMQADSLDEETVLSVSDRRPNSKENPKAQPRIMTSSDNRRGMAVNGSPEDQEGVTIGRIRTPATLKTSVYSREAAVAKETYAKMEGSGSTKDENVVQKEGVSIKTNVGRVQGAIRQSQEDEGVVVGQVRKTKSSSSGDIEVRDTSNIRSEKARAEKATKAAVKPAKAAPAKAEIDTKVSPKIRMARRIDPTFPSSWDFSGKLVERLERAKAHGITPTFLEALYAAEGDPMRRLLEKTYPKQFSA